MNNEHIKALLQGIAPVIKQAIEDAQRPLIDDIAALKARLPEKGEKGDPGKDGIDGAAGKDGRDGVDGKDGLPGERGEKGEKGDPGKDGRDGKDSEPVTEAQIEAALKAHVELINASVAKHLEANPPPAGRDGRDGLDGKDGVPGERGEKGEPGEAGKDGANGRDGLSGVPGRDGKDGAPGKDGRDGLGPEDITEFYEDQGRVLVRQYKRGDEVVKEFRHVTQQMVYRGVWREGDFKSGDVVTFGGSLFVAMKDTATKPETPDCDWKLAAKRGRDGRDGKPGERGLPGMKGDKGDRGDRGYGG